MRNWHRWLAIFAGALLVWIAATGVVGQVMSLAGGEQHEGPPPGVGETRTAKPPRGEDHDGPPGGPDLYHVIIDLHSGAYLGPVGKIVSVLSGAALLFFAMSGMWMYIDMFRKRKRIGRTGLFWK